jgi:hypothetical protein
MVVLAQGMCRELGRACRSSLPAQRTRKKETENRKKMMKFATARARMPPWAFFLHGNSVTNPPKRRRKKEMFGCFRKTHVLFSQKKKRRLGSSGAHGAPRLHLANLLRDGGAAAAAARRYVMALSRLAALLAA